MIEWMGKIENFDKKWQKIMLEMFDKPTVFGTQVHEQLLTSLFLSVDREEQLKRCLPVNNITGTLKRVVLVKLPFQRILEPWTVKLLVDFVIRTREASAHGLLETALKLWSDINYVQKTQEAQERHLVRLILYLIHRLQNQSIIPWNDFFLHASNGVYTRLQMLPVFIRTALFLNETLSGLATKFTENAPEAPKIDIDDSPQQCEETESEWNEEMRHIFKNGIMTSQTSRAETMCIEAPKSSRRAEKVTKKALDSDDDDGEDEDFPTYTVDAAEKEFRKLEAGEEPKKAVKPPDYIQDAFEQLLEREKYEIFEAAFFTLPSLIRRRAVGFSSIAEQLVLRVVHLQDHFNTRQFHETVEEIATATIAQRPQIVPNLVRIIIAPGQAERIQQRLLHFIHKAADEMGSLDQKQAKFVENQQKKLERVHAGFGGTVPEWKKEVEARIASKTRIISRGVQEKVGVKNRLAENAKYMFYPLLVMPRGDMARLLNRDSDLLSLIYNGRLDDFCAVWNLSNCRQNGHRTHRLRPPAPLLGESKSSWRLSCRTSQRGGTSTERALHPTILCGRTSRMGGLGGPCGHIRAIAAS
uniref:Telomere length regulation protein TEL2 homolog n=1 Tax=Caenorhabditis japonica TaxID=281687 RepID=A0A8R1I781_CAEJA